jgi:DNA-binding XRE family transcriptional regulator
MNDNRVRPIGTDWDEYKKSVYTEEEIIESEIRVALIGEIIKLREKSGMSQRGLEEKSGVKQPVIARLEKGITDPQLSTLIKILAPLGKTLAIVPLERNNNINR